MIDPDNIQILESNLPNQINVRNVPDFETLVYDLDDDKDFKHYIKDCKNDIRGSIEYRNMIRYLRENMKMDKCAYISGVNNQDTFDIKIEIHHYPFTLEDIVMIVYKKRAYYNESLDLEMLAKECTMLHYKLLVGLIPLSETIHELCHAGRIFIPLDAVMGRYKIFVDYYKPFCTLEQLETLDRIEKYTEEKTSYLYNTTLLEENRVSYNIIDERFKLPDFNKVSDTMVQRIEEIKTNNYLLPTVNDKPMISNDELDQMRYNERCPIYFEFKR